MFESIFNGISEFFSDVLPHTFCVPCFLKGLAEGFAIGVIALVAIAASPAWLAIALVVTLAAVGIYAVTKLVSNWHNMCFTHIYDNSTRWTLAQFTDTVLIVD